MNYVTSNCGLCTLGIFGFLSICLILHVKTLILFNRDETNFSTSYCATQSVYT